MSDVTRVLGRLEQGDPAAAEQLLPLVYEELRKLAAARMVAERPDHTLEATALVHEAYLRLVDLPQGAHWNSRGHFFAAAAEAMRRILIESARSRQSQKRGGALRRSALNDVAASATLDPGLLLDIDAAISELQNEDPETAALVKLRLFAGLTIKEAGELLGLSRSSSYETWEYARSWLAVWLEETRR